MSSAREHRAGLGIGLGLAAWFAAFFVLTVIGVYALSYHLVGTALEEEWSFRLTEIERSVTGEAVGATIREETGVARPSAEMRASIDEHFRETFFVLVVPIVVLGLAGGVLLTYYAARPVRRVVRTVQAILDTGDLERRVDVGARGRGRGVEDLSQLLNRLLERIDELVRSQRQSLDAVAHDLRTPITRLRASAERAAARIDDPDACRTAVGDFVEESEQLASLVAKLMDVTVAETGTMVLESGVVAVGELLTNIEGLYELVAQERDVDLRTEAGADLAVLGDRDRLRQVLANLVDNAIKYSHPGGRVDVRAVRDGAFVAISVADQGIGIRAEDLPRIWDRLYRADRSRGTPGLGLGLSLVRAIVSVHGGTVNVESAPGQGSTFTVRLPAA